MPRFSANLTFLFAEMPFMERFQAAETAGFAAVEYMFPYEFNIDEIAGELRRLRLRQVLFNLPSGNWAQGDRGIAAHPARRAEFRDGVRQAVDVARRLDCRLLNCLVGLRDEEIPMEEQRACLVDNLRFAARELEPSGIMLLVEPVNPYDIPGFLLTRSAETTRLMDEVGAPNLRLQYDAYHMQRTEGNLVATIQALLPRIGHIQIADPPDRHQPGTGEVNYAYVLSALDTAGYDGFVGLEYRPLGPTEDSFEWIEQYGFTLG